MSQPTARRRQRHQTPDIRQLPGCRNNNLHKTFSEHTSDEKRTQTDVEKLLRKFVHTDTGDKPRGTRRLKQRPHGHSLSHCLLTTDSVCLTQLYNCLPTGSTDWRHI